MIRRLFANRQQGAVLVEACLLGVVLCLLILSGRWLMSQQNRLQQLQQFSHAQVFAHDSQGAPISEGHGLPEEFLVSRRFNILPGQAAEPLRIELLGMRSGAWQVQSSMGMDWPAWMPGVQAALTLVRQSHLLAGAGQADDTQSAKARLAGSRSAWGRATQASLQAAQATMQAAAPLDSAWGRTLPDLDWLGPWQDVAPDLSTRLCAGDAADGEAEQGRINAALQAPAHCGADAAAGLAGFSSRLEAP